ncbi:glutaredoxin-like [Ostrea edulis]|uniref:glutaredoxin-like n=1 Tax=Ostrea edulis TaxID=37623 RepID=UPI0024AF2885|nr:glutaredoxin-like [Ostrea edulis]
MSLATAIEEKIASKKVIMYSKTTCPYCLKAKKVFSKFITEGTLKKGDYEVIEIDRDPKCTAIQTCMLKKTGARTVPRVFINGKFFGGGDETVQMASNGKLKKLLNEGC